MLVRELKARAETAKRQSVVSSTSTKPDKAGALRPLRLVEQKRGSTDVATIESKPRCL